MPKKITAKLKKLILREKTKAPYLGVRQISKDLAAKHNIRISKSAIHNILKNKGVRESPGRKKAHLAYQARLVKPCGLILLRALDSQIGLFDYLTEQLKRYFLDLDPGLLKRLIILASFSFFVDKNLRADLRRGGFLRVVGLSQLPSRTVNHFNQVIASKHPVVSLAGLKQDLKTVSTVKFYFKDGSLGFSDGRLATFWDSLQKSADFSVPLRVVRDRIKKMFDEKLLIIGYTQSFNYLSQKAFNFSRSISSGLSKLEFLSPKGEVLDQMKVGAELSFVFGYSPQIFTPPASSRIRSRKFKRCFHQQLGESYLLNIPATFNSPGENLELKMDNIQIKKGSSSISWGLLGVLAGAKRGTTLANIATQYFYLWPYIQEDFFKEVEAAEGRISLGLMPENPLKMLPNKLVFTQPIDFVRVGQILSVLFKGLVAGWEPRGKSGTLSLRKGYAKIVLKPAPNKLKKAFNKYCFYLDQRRVFLG